MADHTGVGQEPGLEQSTNSQPVPHMPCRLSRTESHLGGPGHGSFVCCQDGKRIKIGYFEHLTEIVFVCLFVFNVYLFLRERERERETECELGRSRERRRHRIRSRLQALNCQHRAQCRAQTHGPRDHDRSQSQTLNPIRHPGSYLFFNPL